MKKKIIFTKDGSPSIFINELNETYHSRHGALTESDYVYINQGLSYWLENSKSVEVQIFEMGFGTGMNLSLIHI